MNARATVQGAGYFAGAAALAVGGSLATLALAGTAPSRVHAEARPAPTVTVTETPALVTVRPSLRASPSPTPTAGATVVAAARPARTAGGVAEGRMGARSNGPAGQSRTSRPPAPASQCGGDVLTVRAARAVCVSVGGSR